MNKSIILTLASLFLLPSPAIWSLPVQKNNLLISQIAVDSLQQTAQAITVKVLVKNSQGSGFIVAKQGNTYTVVTNAHVVERGAPYRIVTPDGKEYHATLITKGNSLQGYDLALLQFDSTINYQVATVDNSPNWQENQEVYGVGFPIASDEVSGQFTVIRGKVSFIPEKPLKGGYQIGFSANIFQGMSGGALLNAEGNVIGVLGMGNAAILDSAYTYTDGTSPELSIIAQMRQFSFAVPIATIAELQPQNSTIVAEIDQIAQQITVRIDSLKNGNGSGVIVAKNKNTYYVLTAAHVVENPDKYKVITPDAQVYSLKPETIQVFEGIDLALVQFNSPKTYQVATLADYPLGKFTFKSDQLDIQKPLVFLSGFPADKSGNLSRQLTTGVAFPQFSNLAVSKDQYSFFDGTELFYTCLSLAGMSGGAVLDHQGRVIGINTGSENESINQDDQIYLGNSLGVPIKTFLGQLNRANLNSQWLNVQTGAPPTLSQEQINQIRQSLFTQKPPTETSSAVDWLNYGKLRSRLDQDEQAIEAYNQAIQRNPQFYQAYYLKGQSLKTLKKETEALTAFDKVIELDPQFYLAWYEKARILSSQEQHLEALSAVNKAIEIAPKDPKLYSFQGIVLDDLERDPEADEALTEAIKLKPNAQGYFGRGIQRSDWGDEEGAIADYTKVIELQPNYSYAYNLRAISFWNVQDLQAALNDIETGIQLDPDNFYFYSIRSLIRRDLGDTQGAIADLTKIIENPAQVDQETLINAYVLRAFSYVKLKEWDKAIAEWTKLIELEPNNIEYYLQRGWTYRSLGERQKQIADYNQAIEIEPDSAQAYIVRAEAYEEIKEEEKAKADYQKAEQLFTQKIQEAPDYPVNYSFRGGARRQLGNVKGAEEDFQKVQELIAKDQTLVAEGVASVQQFRQRQQRMNSYYTKEIEANSNNPKLYFYRGIALYGLREYQNGLQDFNRSLELNPSHAETYYRRGLTYQVLQDYPKALADYNQALALNIFEDTDVYLNRGIVKLKLAKYQEAIEDFNQVLERQPHNLTAYTNRVDGYVGLKDYDNAIQSVNKLIEIQPKNAKFYTFRGNLYFQQGNITAALNEYSKAIEINPNYADTYFYRGVIYHQQGNIEAALTEYNLAVKKDKKIFPAIINIGYIYYEQGEIEPALKQWQEAIKINPNYAEPQLAFAVALYAQGEQAKGIEIAKNALQLDKNWGNLDYLRQNLWGEKLLLDAQKLFQHPEIVTLVKQK